MKVVELKYKEVEREMRQLARTLPVGAKIPPERHLAITYKCNFLTVRKALKALVDDGTIVRRVGSGSFVADRNHKAQSNSAGTRGRNIGLLVYHKSDAYAHKLLQSIAHAAMEEGITLRSSWVKDFGKDGLKQAKALMDDGCVAVVLPWFPHSLTDEIREFVKQSPLPVSLPLVISGLENNYFGRPEEYGQNLFLVLNDLCEYHRSMGRTQIAFLGPSTFQSTILQKMLCAYTCYISKHNLTNLARLTTSGSHSMDEVAGLWKQFKGKLGVMCYDDEHAIRFMTAMHKIGLKAPEDFGIIGHNDTEAGNYSDPPLSTMRPDFSDNSLSLLKNAIALSEGSFFHSDKITSSTLLIRGTCGGKEVWSPSSSKDYFIQIQVDEEHPGPTPSAA